MRLALALTVFGLAGKAGLAPLHSWLPDAHSQAPAPVSGLMSGVLLSVAFYGVLRVQAVADAAGQGGLVRGLLVAGGLASLLVAGVLTLTQRDVKRLLAYSSVEHMGVIALGAAAGGALGIGAVLLHMLGHGLAKAVVFATAGRVVADAGSTRIDDVRALLVRRPDLGQPFLAGVAALLGLPPFVLTLTEIGIVLALVQAGLTWVACVALALLLLSFTGIARHTLAMTLGAAPATSPAPAAGASRVAAPAPTSRSSRVTAPVPTAGASRVTAPAPAVAARRHASPPLIIALVACAALTAGAWPLRDVLLDAAAALTTGGGR